MSNNSSNLVQMTVRLQPEVAEALYALAKREGQESADYASDIILRHVLPAIEQANQPASQRLGAEVELKTKAIALARRLSPSDAFDPSVTLKVFQAIRTDDDLRQLYVLAINDRPPGLPTRKPNDRGNPIKARINRTLGAAIKTAVDGAPKTVDGNPVKVQVSNEFIFSYTLLDPPSET
jgi:hypothetical protein